MPLAVQYDRVGGPEVLHLREVAAVSPGPGQVRVRVTCVGINPYDFKVRRGIAPSEAPFPRGLGSDFAGVIEVVGSGASYVEDGADVRVGDEVLGWGTNTLAEQLLVDVGQITRKPKELSCAVASSLATPGLTAVAALDVLQISARDTILLSAAAGAVGLIYSQLAIARGARVIGTASSANHLLLRRLGVEPIEYGPGLADRVRALGGTVTAVQDNFGRETIEAGFELGVPATRICSIVDHAAVAQYGLASPGRYRRSAVTLGVLARQAAAGELVLAIDSEYPLVRVVEAFTHLESRHLRGKVVVAAKSVGGGGPAVGIGAGRGHRQDR
jgi:NADPH:quinone reductase-like Zn-dependent oxidoreductase